MVGCNSSLEHRTPAAGPACGRRIAGPTVEQCLQKYSMMCIAYAAKMLSAQAGVHVGAARDIVFNKTFFAK
jgi:hypothetical protein